MKYAQLVLGPAGAGKTTYCRLMSEHLREIHGRSTHIVNLDPAADVSDSRSSISIDIQDLISTGDVVDEMSLGPNGALVFAMEYLLDNEDWLVQNLGDYHDDYLFVDCPGQIELYTHLDIMKKLVDILQTSGYRVVAVHLLDSQFLQSAAKMVSGSLACLAAMLNLGLPHLNILSKMDMVDKLGKLSFLSEPGDSVDVETLLDNLDAATMPHMRPLNNAFKSLLIDYPLVQFLPLEPDDEEMFDAIVYQTDIMFQFGEDEEPKEPRDEEEMENNEGDDGNPVLEKLMNDL